MISYNEACKIASDYFFKKERQYRLCSAYDVGDSWLFHPVRNQPRYGGYDTLRILKKDGTIGEYPSVREYISLLKQGRKIEMIPEYR